MGRCFWELSIHAVNNKNYALDYNDNKDIELKEIEDSFASAANYINKIGWELNGPCFIKIKLDKKIPKNT